MKKTLRLFITIIYSLSVFVFAVAIEAAEDPVTADPQHYKVEFENDQVRVLRVTYGPGEKSVMHYHPAGVAVFLTDHHVKFTFPDGRSEERNAKAKETLLHPAGDHMPENLSDEPLELILVELKAK